MAGGVITLPTLEYTVPGAIIDLKGTYGVERGALNFAGFAKMQATVSEKWWVDGRGCCSSLLTVTSKRMGLGPRFRFTSTERAKIHISE